MIENSYSGRNGLRLHRLRNALAELVLAQLAKRMACDRCAVCGTRVLADDPLGLINGRLAHADCVMTDWLGRGSAAHEDRSGVIWSGGHTDDVVGGIAPQNVHMCHPSNQTPAFPFDIAHDVPMTENDITQHPAAAASDASLVRNAQRPRRDRRPRLRHEAAAVEAEIRRLRSISWPPRTRVSSRQADA